VGVVQHGVPDGPWTPQAGAAGVPADDHQVGAVRVHALRGGLRRVAVGDLLSQVFRQIAYAPVGILGPGQHPLSIKPRAKPRHMPRRIVRADRVERRIPGMEDFAGGGPR